MSKITPRMLSAHSVDRLWRMGDVAIANDKPERWGVVCQAISMRTGLRVTEVMGCERFQDHIYANVFYLYGRRDEETEEQCDR